MRHSKFICGLVISVCGLICSACLLGGPLKFSTGSLSPLPESYKHAPSYDWLINSASARAGVFTTGRPHEIVLSNGLLSRTFLLAPNGATVGFDNLVTGETIIRGVKPEAVLEIEGVRFEVGGLKGQPDYAYLKHEWLAKMTAYPGAFKLIGFKVGKPAERLKWKRVRHIPPGVTWPPKGVSLRMDYGLPEVSASQLAMVPRESGLGRRRLIDESFDRLSEEWKVHVSRADPRSSFENEGKTGEIYTPSNTAVFVERNLPEGVRIVEAAINVGTDRSGSWGPAIALAWKGRVIKFNLRPGGSAASPLPMFGVFDGHREIPDLGKDLKIDINRTLLLRLRIEDKSVYCEVRSVTGSWLVCHVVRSVKPFADPRSVRIGKLDRSGGGSDYPEKGELVRLKIEKFAAYGPLDKKTLKENNKKKAQIKKMRVSVHYELYDGIPLMSKWITVSNPTKNRITLNSFTSEILAVVEFASYVEDRGVPFPWPNLHVETDYAFCGMTFHNAMRHSVHWMSDPDYKTQVNYLRHTPCLLEVRPDIGPDQDIDPGKSFESFHTFLLPYDSTERERKSMELHRLYRTVSPWVLENPLMMHVRYADWKRVKLAIDQCAEVGFEMVILSFGSGFNIENDSPQYIDKMKKYADYARGKGIEIGGYSLLASRRINPESDNAINPETGTIYGQTFGTAPALASKWGQNYFRKLYEFFDKTGFTLLEHDGSYPGDLDAAARPPLQKGVKDSRWVQWKIITNFYKYCRAKGVYLNVPDFYYLSGSNKSGMGYRESNWSLPRAEQVIHTRQNIYDGTWSKTPSMGWMFVPLTQYHGGGAAATIEPLDSHLDHYERMLYSNLALGVQACYRGPRLYDTVRTRSLVKRWVTWFKKYRDILESDVVHGRRADSRDIDWMLHVNPGLKNRGMVVVFNPLNKTVERKLSVNLYYTGLEDLASVREREGSFKTYKLDRKYNIKLSVKVAPQGMTWFVIRGKTDGRSQDNAARRMKQAQDNAARRLKQAQDNAARRMKQAQDNAAPRLKQAHDNAARRMKHAQDNALSPVYGPLADYLVNRFSLAGKQGIGIDLGSGPGKLILELCTRTRKMRWINADIDASCFPIFFRAASQDPFSNATSGRISAVQCDAKAMPFKDNYADFIISRGSLQFWGDLTQGLSEVYRVLKPGCVAFIGRGFSENLPVSVARSVRKRQGAGGMKYDVDSLEKKMKTSMQKLQVKDFKIHRPAPRGGKDVNYGIWLEFRKKP